MAGGGKDPLGWDAVGWDAVGWDEAVEGVLKLPNVNAAPPDGAAAGAAAAEEGWGCSMEVREKALAAVTSGPMKR